MFQFTCVIGSRIPRRRTSRKIYHYQKKLVKTLLKKHNMSNKIILTENFRTAEPEGPSGASGQDQNKGKVQKSTRLKLEWKDYTYTEPSSSALPTEQPVEDLWTNPAMLEVDFPEAATAYITNVIEKLRQKCKESEQEETGDFYFQAGC